MSGQHSGLLRQCLHIILRIDFIEDGDDAGDSQSVKGPLTLRRSSGSIHLRGSIYFLYLIRSASLSICFATLKKSIYFIWRMELVLKRIQLFNQVQTQCIGMLRIPISWYDYGYIDLFSNCVLWMSEFILQLRLKDIWTYFTVTSWI